MVSHNNSRRPRLVLLLGTALYLQGAILPTTLAAKTHPDLASDLAQTNDLVKSDPALSQSQQHVSNLQQDSQTVAAVHKGKGKNKKGDKKAARESAAVDAKGTKAHNHSKNRVQDEVKGSNDSDVDSDSDNDNDNDNQEEEEGSGGDRDDNDDKDKRKNDVSSYLADLWKGIVHLGEEPNIQAGIAALTSGIHGVTKHHGKRD
ncbi:hypothetical protein BGZ70_001184, partial [Mortierella alpina]